MTLKWFVFGNQPTVIAKELFLKLKYFIDYPILITSIIDYMIKQGLDSDSMESISCTNFEKIIKSIDDIQAFNKEKIGEIVIPLMKFFEDDTQSTELIVAALIIFLNDKGIYIISEIIETRYFNEGIEKIKLEEFLNIWVDNAAVLQNQLEMEIITAIDSIDNLENLLGETSESSDQDGSNIETDEVILPDFSPEEIFCNDESTVTDDLPDMILDHYRYVEDIPEANNDNSSLEDLLESPDNDSVDDTKLNDEIDAEKNIAESIGDFLEYEMSDDEKDALSEKVETLEFSVGVIKNSDPLSNIEEVHDQIQLDLVNETLTNLAENTFHGNPLGEELYDFTISLANDLDTLNENISQKTNYLSFDESLDKEVIEFELIGLPYLKKKDKE
jgi:hypothetical protein